MRQKPPNVALETYNLKIATFEHGQPEEFLHLTTNFKRVVERTWTEMAAGKLNCLHTILRGETIQEFDKLAIQNAGTNNTHLNFVQEGLTGFLSFR